MPSTTQLEQQESDLFMRSELGHHHAYVLPELSKLLRRRHLTRCDVFDLGCGNGSVAAWLYGRGYDVVGLDPSQEAIDCARGEHPHIPFYRGTFSEDLTRVHGTFRLVVSLDAIRQTEDPVELARSMYRLTQTGGTAVLSAPYHGYWKNLALAVTGRIDNHVASGGPIFWSESSLREALTEAGFRDVEFARVGRLRPFAKSTIAVATK